MPPNRADMLWFLMVETALFVFAALVHRGLFFAGFEHERAAIVELVIAVVLAAGVIYAFARSESTRRIAIYVQGFALLGVVAGFVSTGAGIGPGTTPDLAMLVIMFITLSLGVLVARRAE
jgi:hypothetical protein